MQPIGQVGHCCDLFLQLAIHAFFQWEDHHTEQCPKLMEQRTLNMVLPGNPCMVNCLNPANIFSLQNLYPILWYMVLYWAYSVSSLLQTKAEENVLPHRLFHVAGTTMFQEDNEAASPICSRRMSQ